jgi:hypothetical protein
MRANAVAARCFHAAHGACAATATALGRTPGNTLANASSWQLPSAKAPHSLPLCCCSHMLCSSTIATHRLVLQHPTQLLTKATQLTPPHIPHSSSSSSPMEHQHPILPSSSSSTAPTQASSSSSSSSLATPLLLQATLECSSSSHRLTRLCKGHQQQHPTHPSSSSSRMGHPTLRSSSSSSRCMGRLHRIHLSSSSSLQRHILLGTLVLLVSTCSSSSSS